MLGSLLRFGSELPGIGLSSVWGFGATFLVIVFTAAIFYRRRSKVSSMEILLLTVFPVINKRPAVFPPIIQVQQDDNK